MTAKTRTRPLPLLARRDFLLGAAAVFPALAPASVFGATAPSARINVGMIGVGDQGRHHTKVLTGMADVQVVAVCDPQGANRRAARQIVEGAYGARAKSGAFGGCAEYNDFRDLLARDDIDAVFVTSPEHWHALHGIAAAQAGKDLYIEKALTVTIDEGKALVRAVRRHGRVCQVGTHQRSQWQFRHACELVRNGYIGRLHTIATGLPAGYAGPNPRPQSAPRDLDWDLWLGPTVWTPYAPERIANLTGWMLDGDRCVGFQAGWGQHHNDIAQWGNGTDATGPIEVEGRGVFPSDGMNTTPQDWHTEYTYANGVRLVFTTTLENPMGIRFEGTEGWVFVSRETIEAHNPALLDTQFGPDAIRLYDSRSHHRDFIDCVKSRRDPICSVETGHRAATICNLSDISIRLGGRKLRWDPVQERFPQDDEANQMLHRAMRAPWSL